MFQQLFEMFLHKVIECVSYKETAGNSRLKSAYMEYQLYRINNLKT